MLISPNDFDLTKLYCYDKLKHNQWIENSIGSLGGGNHFIEIDKDDDKEEYKLPLSREKFPWL